MANSVLCLKPFYLMEFAMYGSIYCCCPAWLNGPVGNITDGDIRTIWNGPDMIRLRENMYSGNWQEYCRDDCPTVSLHRIKGQSVDLDALDTCAESKLLTPKLIAELRAGKTRLESTPTELKFGNSPLCNLNCIMCHRIKQKEDRKLVQKTLDSVWPVLPDARRLLLCGHGDPFVRPDALRILTDLDGSKYPDLRINLITNGLLMPKYWDRVKHQNFGWLNISIDGAAKPTYERIRRKGKWEKLIEALDLAKANRQRFESIIINMTVNKMNYRQMPQFIEMAERYGFVAWFTPVILEYPPADMPEDWCIFNYPHSREFKEFQSVLRDISTTTHTTKVNYDALLPYL